MKYKVKESSVLVEKTADKGIMQQKDQVIEYS